jgi:hypothetical protein
MADPLNDLTKKLGLLQTAAKNAAKKWAARTLELQNQGQSPDQAAITAARNVFESEFKATKYDYQGVSVADLLSAIEAL